MNIHTPRNPQLDYSEHPLGDTRPLVEPEHSGVAAAGASNAFLKGACVFYLTAGGTLAVLRRHYCRGASDSTYGFDYALRRPTPPKFTSAKAVHSIRFAVEAGREVLVGKSLIHVIAHLAPLVERQREIMRQLRATI